MADMIDLDDPKSVAAAALACLDLTELGDAATEAATLDLLGGPVVLRPNYTGTTPAPRFFNGHLATLCRPSRRTKVWTCGKRRVRIATVVTIFPFWAIFR